MPKTQLSVEIDTRPIDEAIEKTDRLIELLREAQQIIGSLAGSENWNSSGKGRPNCWSGNAPKEILITHPIKEREVKTVWQQA